MWILSWLAEFIGRILKHILPTLLDEAKKPKKVKQIGGDDEVRNSIDTDITNVLRMSMEPNANSKTPGQSNANSTGKRH